MNNLFDWNKVKSAYVIFVAFIPRRPINIYLLLETFLVTLDVHRV